ncbi:MAG: patatin-like phospholipase family protein [Myxococcales bacterium]|nr:patatin-like phospholipase family protein [Myxococcales bacterium]
MAPITGLVLSGGGARGAYEVGIIAGIIEALGKKPRDKAPFQVFAGSSVGAINSTFCAANTDRGDLAAADLVGVWSDLRLPTHLRVDPLRLMGWRRLMARFMDDEQLGTALLDSRPLDRVVARSIPWDRLHANIRDGRTRALVIAALRVANGRTAMFYETHAEAGFQPSRDPKRIALPGPIGPAHVLASAAIPVIFPARRIGSGWYCDGGLRFNTPIAPAIRAGAERLVVVSLKFGGTPAPVPTEESYPNPLFLMGKVLNALLLDPISYDLQILERFNQVVEVLDATLDPAARATVDRVVEGARGAPYRRLETLVFTPSRDLGLLAGEHLRSDEVKGIGRVGAWMLRRASQPGATWEDDLASYLLFDGGYARRLIELGRADVRARADEVRAFFGH